MNFCELTEKQYNDFLNKHSLKTFLSTPHIGKIRKKDGWEYNFLGVKKDNKIVGATMLLSRNEFLGKKEFYAIRGFLIDYKNIELLTFFTNNIKKFIKEHDGFILRIDPYLIKYERDIDGNIIPNGNNNLDIIKNLNKLGFKEINAEQAKWMFVLDLENKNIEQLLKEMKPNTRNCINKTFKENLIIRNLNYNELDKFVKITDDTSERRHFTNKNLEYYQDMYNLFGEDIRFVVAEINTEEYLNKLNKDLIKENQILESLSSGSEGRIKEQKIKINSIEERIVEAKELTKIDKTIILSAAMFITYGDEVIYLSSGNYKKYMHFYAQYRIQYEMIKYGTENNYKLYNFYGISGNFDEKDERYGVYKFKKGFNGYVMELIGEYSLPINNIYYKSYSFINNLKKVIKNLIRK